MGRLKKVNEQCRIKMRERLICMFSRLNRVLFSGLSIVAVVLTMVMGASGTVLCIARDHTAIELAQAGDCTSCPDLPAGRTESPADRNADSSGCGSCLDIPLSGTMVSSATPARHSGTFKVLTSVLPANIGSTVASDLLPAVSFQSGGHADNTLIAVSTTVLRI